MPNRSQLNSSSPKLQKSTFVPRTIAQANCVAPGGYLAYTVKEARAPERHALSFLRSGGRFFQIFERLPGAAGLFTRGEANEWAISLRPRCLAIGYGGQPRTKNGRCCRGEKHLPSCVHSRTNSELNGLLVQEFVLSRIPCSKQMLFRLS